LLPKDIDDSGTEMVKTFTSHGFAYTNILINGVCKETVCENGIATTQFCKANKPALLTISYLKRK
jgi:hypothetical protein